MTLTFADGIVIASNESTVSNLAHPEAYHELHSSRKTKPRNAHPDGHRVPSTLAGDARQSCNPSPASYSPQPKDLADARSKQSSLHEVLDYNDDLLVPTHYFSIDEHTIECVRAKVASLNLKR
ncbi:MAG TPA: hypothetical protein VLZ12_06175 [Verrucomicrobiae bacterium]|nr:hypothetical protein [Verrucomicrobiae bacterium]